MGRYDIAIIGTGPAGVSAAITATVRNKSIVLFGTKALSEKMRRAHGVLNYPGLPGVTGDQLADALSGHLDALNIQVDERRVGMAFSMGDYYTIQAGEDMVEATAVVLASGVVQGKPLEGEKDLVGSGVSYCATCDAAFFKGKTVAVVGYGREAEAEADFLSEVAAHVLYFPQYRDDVHVAQAVEVLHERARAIEGTMRVEALKTDGGVHPVDGVFVLRDAISPEQMVPGLELEQGHVPVDGQMRTAMPGLFACGDIAGKPYQYVKAAGQGNVAALSAVSYVDDLARAKQG